MIKVKLILKLGLISSLFLFALHKEAPYKPIEKVNEAPFDKTYGIEEGIENFKKWRGTFHYELKYSDDFFDPNVSFLKMKGLRGEDVERIILDGNINFTPKVGNSLYVGRGAVKYDVSLMHYAALGEGMVIHYTDGNGSEKIIPNRYRTNLRINYRHKKYSLRIDPGIYEADLDAIGLPVENFSNIKVTKAMIRKLEEEGRPILYPETLNEMFPDRSRQADRLNVVVEAFDIPFSSSSNTLKGTYTDEKGGILTWEFVAY